MQTDHPRTDRPARLRQWVGGQRRGARRGSGETRHRDVKSGTARAAVLGAGDGLLTNLSLVLGVAGASVPASTVRLAGIAGLLAGAFSMAAGELVSVRAQQELAERELQVERNELADTPDAELTELTSMYRSRGLSVEDAQTVARILSSNEDVALDTHARLELGIDPDQPGAPIKASAFSFAAFTAGALLPLLPWFFMSGTAAIVASLLIGAVASLVLGAFVGAMAGRSRWRSALRQLVVAVVAAGITYSVGHLLGVSTQ